MTTPREKYERRRQTLTEHEEAGRIDSETAEAIRELCDAYDDDNLIHSPPDDESSRKVSTLMSWCYRCMAFGQEQDLTTATAEKLNRDVQAMHDGEHPQVSDEGIQKGTLRSYQAALRRFYKYHDYGVDPEDIPLFDQKDSPVDPSDMLTKEEIHDIRGEIDNIRDQLIFDLLVFTGQRREALRTLRLKDVFPQDGEYRLNPEADGLKGAGERHGRRPLLGAVATVREWLEYHPDTSDNSNYLITARPNWNAVDPTTPVSGETIRRVMQDIKEEVGISKPLHPHAARHNFVTISKRDYDLPDDTIKYLIGHSADSSVMETTYSHLSDEDHIQRAEEAWGIREEEDTSPFTPEVCPTCKEPQAPDAKACSRCGTVFTPDAHQVQELIGEAIHESAKDATTEAEKDEVDMIRKLAEEKPEALADVVGIEALQDALEED